MDQFNGRVADVVHRIDVLRELTLTKIAEAIRQANLTLADVGDYVKDGADRYHRQLVVRRESYELLVLTWKPGQGSVPHDHAGSVSAMQVLQGEAIEGTWRTSADGYVDQEFETPVRCGEMTAWQDAGVHTVRNSADSKETLITVHVYAPPLTDFRRFVARPATVTAVPRSQAAIPTIAIVGGGFSGSMSAAQVLRQAATSGAAIRVVLIERNGAVGEGLAYATRDGAHLLNVAAGRMSAWPDRPNDFVQWASRRYHAVEPSSFLPRQWYGEYIREILTAVAQEAGSNANFTVAFDEVRRLVRQPDGRWMISFAHGPSLAADGVVLAIGHRPPSDPIGRLWSGPRERFIADPWQPFAANAIQDHEPVVILGSGLTAVDTVLTLAERPRTGPITLVSRRGLLPQSHATTATPPMNLGPVVAELLQAPEELRAHSLARLLHRKAREVMANGGDWRSVMDGLRPHTAVLWQALPVNERRQFLTRLRPFWEVHRHRMAPDVAKRFYELLERKAVRIVAGSVASAAAEPDGIRLYVRERGDDRLLEIRAGWVINCTGPTASNSADSNPAIGSLIVHGYVRPDELSLGLETTSNGNAIDATGKSVANLFIVGTLRKPLLWESTAVPELREQAAMVAEQLIEQLRALSVRAA
jgi:uncharacterized NAD(P)/FAD-binding protein YdhS/predicted metal-dependent enzyme (double-stranded beta helix superfamily)